MVAPFAFSRRTISACWALAASEPLPPRPVVLRANFIGVDPLLFGRRGSAPASSSAPTASAHLLRMARCKGVTPPRSTAFGSAPAATRLVTVARCATGSHLGEPGPPSTA